MDMTGSENTFRLYSSFGQEAGHEVRVACLSAATIDGVELGRENGKLMYSYAAEAREG